MQDLNKNYKDGNIHYEELYSIHNQIKYLPKELERQVKENVVLKNKQVVGIYNPFHIDEYQLGVILLLCFNCQSNIDQDIKGQIDALIN